MALYTEHRPYVETQTPVVDQRMVRDLFHLRRGPVPADQESVGSILAKKAAVPAVVVLAVAGIGIFNPHLIIDALQGLQHATGGAPHNPSYWGGGNP